MLEGHGLTSVRDGRVLFKDLDMRLKPSQGLHVQGPNGAGKTTLLRILCGLTQPRDGTVHWCGQAIERQRFAYHRELLYSGHVPGIKEELTALENLRFITALAGQKARSAVLEQALQQVGLWGYEDVLVRVLSAGQRRRVALARLWLSHTRLWVLDEPFTALDREGIENLQQRLIHHLEQGGMVVLTSHQALDWGSRAVHPLRLQQH